MDSDGEYENGGMPIMRTISHDEHTTPAPSALRKVKWHTYFLNEKHEIWSV